VIIGGMHLRGVSLTAAILESELAAFARGDVDAVVEHFTENCVLTVMIDGLPVHGRDAARDYLEKLVQMMPTSAMRVTSTVASDTEVVAEVELRGRWPGDAPNRPELKRARVCIWSVLEDGRIREQRVYLDRRSCKMPRQSTISY
jgi:ketosteroid isomerase-like protein